VDGGVAAKGTLGKAKPLNRDSVEAVLSGLRAAGFGGVLAEAGDREPNDGNANAAGGAGGFAGGVEGGGDEPPRGGNPNGVWPRATGEGRGAGEGGGELPKDGKLNVGLVELGGAALSLDVAVDTLLLVSSLESRNENRLFDLGTGLFSIFFLVFGFLGERLPSLRPPRDINVEVRHAGADWSSVNEFWLAM